MVRKTVKPRVGNRNDNIPSDDKLDTVGNYLFTIITWKFEVS